MSIPSKQRALFSVFAIVGLLWSAMPGRAEAQEVSLRPVDRAAVRLISLNGVGGQIEQGNILHLGVNVSHGTGVFIRAGGWIATAAHVIDGSDYLIVVLPGEERGRPAEVVFRSSAHDLALVRVTGDTPAPIRPSPRAGLRIGQTLHGSGYPLDPRERWPAAVSGEVGRPLNDGRVQLSMSVNPGNSGGPIITERGHLVGIVTQRADPTLGAQGIAIMEPIAPLVQALDERRHQAAPELPAESTAADLFLELLSARTTPGSQTRLSRLGQVQPQSQPEAALWVVEAVELQRQLLVDAGVRTPGMLNAEQLASYQEAGRLAVSWTSQGQTGTPELASRYQALSRVEEFNYGGLAGGQRGGGGQGPDGAQGQGGLGIMHGNNISAQGSVSGAVMGPSPWAPESIQEEDISPVIAFGLGGAGGLTIDNQPNADSVVGGLFGLSADLRLFLAYTPYFRLAATLGAELPFGFWRERSVIAFLGAAGLRMEIGPPGANVFFRAAYTPGYVGAEDREHAVSLGYQVAAGLKLDAMEIGLQWRELGRSADSTLRSLQLTFSWELLP